MTLTAALKATSLLLLCGATLHAQTPATPSPAITSPVETAATADPLAPRAVTVSTDAPATPAPSAEPESSIRIVRLSQVKGDVRLDRGIGHGLETAFANLPIVQGARLSTSEAGVAEVEFEDNSSLRLTPGSLIEFPHLALRQSGVKATSVRVLKGTVYFSMSNNKTNDFTVLFAKDHFALPPSTHVALSVESPSTRLVVFDGTVQVEIPSSAIMTVSKKKSLLFDPADQALPTLAGNHEASPFDQWDKTSASYHSGVANLASFGGGSSLYGLNDLNYYGSFVDGGAGCGSVWRPYFAGAGFNPFANGVWAQYPGAGYSFVSPYPWGWTPFHSGTWASCAGGWGWRPGSGYYGLNNSASLVRQGTALRPTPPSLGAHAPSMVVVSTQPIAASRLSPGGLVIQQNSAGLGVPREGLGHLGKLSSSVAQHGSVTANIDVPAAAGFTGAPAIAGNARSASQNAPSAHSDALSTPSHGSFGAAPSAASHASGGGSAGGGSAAGSSSTGGHGR